MNYRKLFRHIYLVFGFSAILPAFHACNDAKSIFSKEEGIAASARVDTAALNSMLVMKFGSNEQGPFKVWENDTADKLEQMKNVYKAGTNMWFSVRGINEQGRDLLNVLDDLQYDGLDTKKYRKAELLELSKEIQHHASKQNIFSFETKMTNAFLTASKDMLLGSTINTNIEIKNANDSLLNETDVLFLAIKGGDMLKAFEFMRPKHPWYKKFRAEYVKLNKMKFDGGLKVILNIRDSIKIGDSAVQVVALRKRLYKEINSPADTSSQIWDLNMQESLKKFQHLHQLKMTGTLDTATINRLNVSIDKKLAMLALNMERMRWLRRDFKQPYIWVDIPKMEMDYVDHDSTEFSMRVVVGRPSRRTPALDAIILNVVLSPPWNVPPTIMREEVVPGIARRGGSYLSRRGLRAYDRRGRPVSASAINSKNYRNFSIGQAPGYGSSLGEVKFNMPNPWAIYMHDTPHREDFVKQYRAFSSGCVRVHKPKEFATFLLRDSVKYSYQKIDSICKLRKTIFVPVNRNIDVYFVYLTNALDSAGNVMYLKDIYGWD